MDNKEALDLLMSTLNKKNGAVIWNEYRAGQSQTLSLVKAELSEVDLKGYNLTRVDLTAAKFFNSDLNGVDLSYSNLSYGDFRRSNLASAFLTNADLTVANLTGANMVDTNLDYAKLRSAKLGGAYMVGASFIEANLEGADFRGACLKFANLTGASVKGANVEDADLTNAVFTEDMIPLFKRFERAIISNKHLSQVKAGKAGRAKALLSEMDYEDLFPEEDCYRILGVDKSASLEQIQQTYKKRVKEYHPDLVAHLGKKLQVVARREFERIQLAYKSLSCHRSKPLMQISPDGTDKLEKKSLHQYTMEDYLKILPRYPNNDRLYYNLGIKYIEAGLVDSAIKAYEKALSINPHNLYARHNLKIAQLLKTLQET